MNLDRMTKLAEDWVSTLQIPDKLCIHIFEDPVFYNNAYVGLYDSEGKRYGDTCLIIWNKRDPKLVNPGYAPGRCPDRI